jgi:signal transduction histidine kinase
MGRQRLDELRELTRGALAEMRTLLMELRPKAVLETDIEELLEQLSSGFVGRTRIPVDYQLEVEAELPDDVKVAFYRILQESLNNTAKHARADQVWIAMEIRDTGAEMSIRDDGIGFDPEAIPAESLGVGIMMERAKEINAVLEIDSVVGAGTEVQVIWNKEEENNND